MIKMCRSLSMADYDAVTYTLEETVYNVSDLSRNYEIRFTKSFIFGLCFTFLPRLVYVY
jgi:hypothetical protein